MLCSSSTSKRNPLHLKQRVYRSIIASQLDNSELQSRTSGSEIEGNQDSCKRSCNSSFEENGSILQKNFLKNQKPEPLTNKKMTQKELTQSEAAITALLTAIDCYKAGNYVSSIILSGAARQILNDLCISKQLTSTVKLIGESVNKTTMQVHDFIAKTYNSLKHADRNPGQTIIASSEEAQMLIILAAADLARMNPTFNADIKEIFNFAKYFQGKQNG